MADHKPLPALPTPSLTTLSIDARAHRGRLIRHILAEISDSAIQVRQEVWASAFEGALDDLSDNLDRRGWLAGLRRRRDSKYKPPPQSQGTLKEVGRVQSSNAITQSRVFPSTEGPPRIPDLLEQLRKRVAQNPAPVQEDKLHLLICLSPYGARVHFPPTERGFDPTQANLGCTFAPLKFLLPSDTERIETAVLYGLKEWDGADTSPPRIVGGTLTFRGIDSPSQHAPLAQILRISIYIHLSLLLEQHFLYDSHVHIKFPRPKFTFPSSETKLPNRRHIDEGGETEGEEEAATAATMGTSIDKSLSASPSSRNPFLPSGGILKSFFSRKKSLSHRAQTVNQTGSRGSLDLILNPPVGGAEDVSPNSPGTSIDSDGAAGLGVSRLRRFSLMGVMGGSNSSASGAGEGHERRPSFRRRAPSPDHSAHPEAEPTDGSFLAALKRVERSRSLLSTSPGVVFFPPPLLVDLAAKEAKCPTRRLRGEEKAALGSILGWTGKDAAGRGMSGIPGFVRQQEFSFLVAGHIPVKGPLFQVQVPAPAPLPAIKTQIIDETTPTNSTLTSSTIPSSVESPAFSSAAPPPLCGRPQWFTHRYFDFRQQDGDRRLGETILDILTRANVPCATPGCTLKHGEHETRIIHGGFRVTVSTRDTEGFEISESDKDEGRVIEMWESCRVCDAKTGKNIMSNGTYLFSYTKFLELLIYSPSICVLSPALCEHTTPSPPPLTPPSVFQPPQSNSHSQSYPPESRLNIIRHFGVQNATASFSISIIEDIFELRVPRLQIYGSCEDEHESETIPSSTGNNNPSTAAHIEDKRKGTNQSTESDGFGEDKKVLRREIKRWWEGVADHMDKLERLFASLDSASDVSSIKRLPRLPSVDDAYVDFGLETGDEGDNTDEKLRTPRAVPPKELPTLDPPPNTPEEKSGTEDGEDDEVAKTPTRSRKSDVMQAPLELDEGRKSISLGGSKAPSIFNESSESSRDSASNTSSFTPPTNASTTGSRLSISSVASNTSSTASPASTASPTPTPSILTSSTADDKDPRERLESLRRAFQRVEHELYAQLIRTPENSLNDIRQAFHTTARGAQKRLAAWQKKHIVAIAKDLKDQGKGSVGEGLLHELGIQDLKELIEMKDPKALMKCEEPEWWGKGHHAIPGSSVIVREDDWGSIIAFTLGSPDYHHELVNLAFATNRPATSAPVITPAVGTSSLSRTTPAGASSFFTTTTGKLFGSSINDQPDPDRDDVVWHEPEVHSAVISRKEHPKDSTSLLSIREVLRHKPSAADGAMTPPTKSGAQESPQTSLASVYAKPNVGVSMEAAGGEVTLANSSTSLVGAGIGQDTVEGQSAGKILSELGGRSRSNTVNSRNIDKSMGCTKSTTGTGEPKTFPAQTSASIVSDQDGLIIPTSSHAETHIKRTTAESIFSLGNDGNLDRAPTPPPKNSKGKQKEQTGRDAGAATVKSLPTLPGEPNTHQSAGSSSSSFAHTITNTLSMAMRLVLSQPDPSELKHPTHPPPVPKKQQHHNLLLADLNSVDERPHIKYDWTIGKRLKFSCTVYYARQFDLMRKRCGVDDSFLKSLERSVSWTAEGGKSKSNFRKTLDDRFIIKTLVNAWNVADLQALIELAPSYFRYVGLTANRASVLAKLIGFYTIEIRNLETGVVQSKADLLVMENLFYKRNIHKMFDLKGIQGRKVKTKARGSKTLFDNEWIEGQQRALLLLRSHSKNVLREAIRSDADFLAKCNIMDYSLLLGIDEEKKQVACGLVDTIGSYTFAKTLEYKAKHNLQSGKEVTVIPPVEYQERFVHALEDYFVVCPDKWSKPVNESKAVSDPFLLSNVL